MPAKPSNKSTLVTFSPANSPEPTVEDNSSTPVTNSSSANKPLIAWTPVGPPIPPAPKDTIRVIADTLERNDSIYLSLKRHHLSDRQLALLDQALRKVFNPAHVKPDDYYTLAVDSNDVIQHFLYTPHRSPDRPVQVELRESSLIGHRLDLPLERRTEILSLRIKDNLSNAISTAGESDGLSALLFDEVFGAVIDFQLDPRQGDQIGIVFEKLYKDSRFVRYGHVLLARYQGQRISKLGIRYPDQKGQESYYDSKGESLGRMFLLKPLSVNRVTSRFNRKRFHPILKKRVPHLGTDYGAPTGTHVWTTARGKVTYAGRKGGYGKMVEVTHANNYRTRYAHLSKILVRKGQRLQQKDLIGEVGATGRATGPHLHYEIIKNSTHINPERINKGATGQALAQSLRPAFAQRRDALLRILEDRSDTPHLAIGSTDRGLDSNAAVSCILAILYA